MRQSLGIRGPPQACFLQGRFGKTGIVACRNVELAGTSETTYFSIIAMKTAGSLGCSLVVGSLVCTPVVKAEVDVSFSNPAAVTIPSAGPATPYPSVINVAQRKGKIISMTVTISSLTHSFPQDIDVLLVGPSGKSVLLMSDVEAGHLASPE